MALFSRLRLAQLSRRSYSTILSPDSATPLSAREKTRSALSLLKSEKNPERILEICRAASLTPETHLDRVAFSLAISKLTKANHFDGIRRFLEDCKTRPDLKTERFASHAIILYGQAGMLDQAIQTFKGIEELGIPQTVKSFNALLFSATVAKNFKEVKRIFMEFPKIYGIERDLETFNTVIKAFSESGSSSSAYSMLAEMDRMGIKPNAATFRTLIAGFYKEGKLEEVGKVLDLMKEKYGIKQNLAMYNTRIQSLCKLKKTSEAKALYDELLSRRVKPNSATYFHLIHGFCREGNYEEAKKMFKSMVSRGCNPDSECYFTLVYYLCQGSDFEGALNICKESMAKNWVPNITTMKSLVNGLVSVSKVDDARELIGQMKEKFSNNADSWSEIEAGLPQ